MEQIEKIEKINEEGQEMTASEILEEWSQEAADNNDEYNSILYHLAQIAGIIARLSDSNSEHL